VQRDAEDEAERQVDADTLDLFKRHPLQYVASCGPETEPQTCARHSSDRYEPARKNPIGRTPSMIRKLSSGKYRLYSRKVNPKTGKRRNLGTFGSRAAAEKHERAVQYFKRH
jgi:hypothetical protein